MSLRVVAGAWGGRRLKVPAGAATRPTADRVREALFSILAPVDDLEVLDLFAGSGALGIEALSRGAGSATFVDSAPAAIRVVRANLESLEAGPETEVAASDWRAFLRKAATRGRQWDLVFCDPPYRLAHRLAKDLGGALAPVLTPQARVVSESSARQPLRLELPLLTERRYGDTLIAVHSTPED